MVQSVGEIKKAFMSNDWQEEGLRLTAFPSDIAATIDASTWWETLTGAPSENKVTRPRENLYQEEGLYKNNNLVLAKRPDRIDWHYVKQNDQPFNLSEARLLNEFCLLMSSWFKESPTLKRLAFGAVFHIPAVDRVDGYKKLEKYLPDIKLDAENSSDFSYQINRPRNSAKISGLKINRLSKWSVALRVQGMISRGPVDVSYIEGQHYYGTRLEIDINTSPEFKGDLPKDELSKVFDELVELGLEITHKGDVK